MANRFFIGFLFLLLLALVGWVSFWFFDNFERQTEEIRSGYSDAARRNPLLAAERFLERLELRIQSLAGRDWLKNPPQETGMLLVKDLGPSLPPLQEEALLDWVERGGHLIASLSHVPDEDETQNHLLETLETRLVNLPLDERENDLLPSEFRLPGIDEPIKVNFDVSRVLRTERDDMTWAIPAGQGAHLLSFQAGSGMITLLSDIRFFNNGVIDQHDHALFLAGLMQDHERGWLLYSSQMPSLLLIAWRSAPQLVISSLLLSVMLLWWLTYRSGPILLWRNPQRRSLLEHLQAAAEFRWRQDRAHSLLETTRRQLETRWLLSHPVLQNMNRQERCRWLAERTGLSSLSIEAAFYGEERSEAGLIETSVIQQRLLAALHPDKQWKNLC